MKMTYKYLFIVTFVISSFLFIDYVQADYKATVMNPANTKCEINGKVYNGSSCFYKDKNLNSVSSGLYALDTGDVITVIENGEQVATKDTNLCSDYYVKATFYFDSVGNTFEGYFCNANLKKDSLLNDDLKNQFKNAGFPESYWDNLAFLKSAHPNWNFVAIDTELTFEEVVQNEWYGSRSLLRRSMSNNYAYLEVGPSSFNYKDDYYIAFDDVTGSDPWYRINTQTISYYLDPRNFLRDMYIFQFKSLAYDTSSSDDKMKESIKSIFGSDYLANFTDTFLEAGKQSGVCPIYLASLSKGEVANGATPGTAINGQYNGMYNFYNIGATSGSNPVYRGLDFAAGTEEDVLKPWNTQYRAIVGGAKWIKKNYLSYGQDTGYFKKFDVVYNYLIRSGKTPNHANYTHQYMQDISAPSTEAHSTYRAYYKNGLLDLSYVFFIPVYRDMPASTALPDASVRSGWPNNYLKEIVINDKKVADFDGDIEEYNYYVDINTPKVKIEAKPVNGSATISGLGTFDINENTSKTLKVTAQNGDIKYYKINFILTGTKIDDPIDVTTTLNNAGIKNNDKYLSGFNVGSDISAIRTRITNANSNAVVSLRNKLNQDKQSGVVATGDKVIITIGSETKEYEIVIYGDVNGDGKIKATDYVLIKNKIMGSITLSGAYLEAADVDHNKQVKATDYVKIKNMIMGAGTINQ